MYFVQGPWSDTCVEVHVNVVHFLCICTIVSFHAKSDQMTVTNDKEKQVVSKQRVADHGEVYTWLTMVRYILPKGKSTLCLIW